MAESLQIRASEEVQAKFKAMANELGMKHGDALSIMINALESEKAAQAVPDMEQAVRDFNAYTAQLQRLYNNSVTAVGLQRDLARESVRRELSSKDELIMDLQERLKEAEKAAKEAAQLEGELEKLRKAYSEAQATIEVLTQIRDTMPDPQKYADLAKRVIELEAASIEKDKLIEKLLSGRQTEEIEEE